MSGLPSFLLSDRAAGGRKVQQMHGRRKKF